MALPYFTLRLSRLSWLPPYGLASDGSNPERSYAYDANGNRTHVYAGAVGSALQQSLQFDGDNRLTQVVTYNGGTKAYQYSYDCRTRRVVRNETAAGGAATVLSFSGGTSVQEWEGGQIEVELIRGSDWGGGVGGVLYTIRDATFAAKSYNSRGDVVSQTDGIGVVNWQASYEAFGTRTAEADPFANEDRQKANTKEEDPTGLLNEGMRYRDLETGVFITRDPAGFVDGPNVYTYVRQNPWTMFDPEGLWGFGESNGAWLDDAWNSYVTPASDFAHTQAGLWNAWSDANSEDGDYIQATLQGTMGNLVSAIAAVGDKKAHTDSVQRLSTMTESVTEDGDLTVMDGAQIVGTAGGEMFGWNDAVEATTGASLEDGRQLSGEERFLKGTSATAKAAGTASLFSKVRPNLRKLTNQAQAQLGKTARCVSTAVGRYADGSLGIASSRTVVPRVQAEWAAKKGIRVVNGTGHAEVTLKRYPTKNSG